jgi:protein ImuA
LPIFGKTAAVTQTREEQRRSLMNSLVEQLRTRIRAVETENRNDQGELIQHGCTELDRLLPNGGYPRGSLVQWLTAGGQGANYLALQLAGQACLAGGALVVIDPLREFYPPAAAAMGIELDNLIILQPTDKNDLLWSIDQSLRCPAVAAVCNIYGGLGIIDELWFRRFQLSAESSGCLGLLVQPLMAGRRPSWAEVQWLVHSSPSPSPSPLPSPQPVAAEQPAPGQHCQLELQRCRGGLAGQKISIRIDQVHGTLCMSSPATQPSPTPRFPSENVQLPAPLPAPQLNSPDRLPLAS